MIRRWTAALTAVLILTALAVPALAGPPRQPGPPPGVGRPAGPVGVELNELGRYTAPDAEFDDGGAEIVAHDPGTQRLFVANGSEKTVDVLDISDASAPTLVSQIDLSSYGDGINGVGVGDGLVGVAVEPADAQLDTGLAVFLDPATLAVVGQADVGHLPDAIVFSPDGSVAMIANEGEPNGDYSIDPEGSVTIVDTETFAATQVDFLALTEADLDDSVRIFGPGASIAQDLEPENITFSSDGATAWVTLQENNAIAEIDVAAGALTGLFGLGFKDWSTAGAGFDASNRDDAINLRNWPVLGIPHPDGIASFTARGETYLVTANEGDARDYDTFSEEARVADVELCDDVAYGGMDAQTLQLEENLGRLNITTVNGFDDARGCFAQLYAYGTRSFSIYRPDGALVYDSGSDFEEITAALLGRDGFNANNDESGPDAFDSRSDDKGPEPEGVAVGKAYGQTYAFVGLERVGGVMTYRVSDPTAPQFIGYTTSRDFQAASAEESIDLGPEGVLFVEAGDSPTGRPLVILSHEVTGSTTIYQVDLAPPGRR